MGNEERIMIGGVVRDSTGTAVDGAWVRLDPLGMQTHTECGGRFVFAGVSRGTSYVIRAQAVEIGSVRRTVAVPAAEGEYDLTLP